MKQKYYSCGKLLITGEYLVLRGARGLALPTSLGQYLSVEEGPVGQILWNSLDQTGKPWFACVLDLVDLDIISTTDRQVAVKLVSILNACRELSSEALRSEHGYEVETSLEFPRDWGLGSSSTLVNCIADWVEVDSYELFSASMSGSGYDVKVAEIGRALIFWKEESSAMAMPVEFMPSFKDSLWFVHLGMKKDSEQEVIRFSEVKVNDRDIDQISRLTIEIVGSADLDEFIRLLTEHDLLLSRILSIPSADEVFNDYSAGYCKYLGAWGGDFMMVTGDKDDMDHFKERGFSHIIPYDKMIQL